MKFRIKNMRFVKETKYVGKRKGFEMIISVNNNSIYVVIHHLKKDIRYNSLWNKLTFDNIEKAIEFCENFDSNNYFCLGVDV